MSNAVNAVSNGLRVKARAIDVPSSSFVVAPATAAKGNERRAVELLGPHAVHARRFGHLGPFDERLRVARAHT